MKRGRGRTFCLCERHEEVTGRASHGSTTDYLSYPLSVRGSQQLFDECVCIRRGRFMSDRQDSCVFILSGFGSNAASMEAIVHMPLNN